MNLEQLTSDFPDLEVVKPSQLFKGQKRNTPISPDMLLGEDARMLACKLDGEKNHSLAEARIVVFDRNYAINKFTRDYRLLLKSLTAQQWLDFALEVWEVLNE